MTCHAVSRHLGSNVRAAGDRVVVMAEANAEQNAVVIKKLAQRVACTIEKFKDTGGRRQMTTMTTDDCDDEEDDR